MHSFDWYTRVICRFVSSVCLTLNQLRFISKSQFRLAIIFYLNMKQLLLILAIAFLALSGILPDSTKEILSHTPNPNDIFKQVRFEPLSYCDPVVEVKLTDIQIGWNAVAYGQYLALYPAYNSVPIKRCFYSALGITRFYTFTITTNGSSKNVTTAIQVDDGLSNETQTAESEDQKDGFSQVSVSWAQQDPVISFALNAVIKNNWDVIKGNPVDSCWTRPNAGVWDFRFYFRNVNGRFEYSNSESNTTASESNNSTYYAEVQPIFVVGDVAEYKSFDIESFKKTAEYSSVVAQLKQELGSFNEKWILNVSISVSAGVSYIKVTINFQPFLLKQDYEAQYYGSVKKAALLKLDEQVFNPNGQSFQNWQEIKDFASYRAFGDASLYAQSQFTWLRFYTVVAAYSALHLKGRYVRLVYQGLKEYVDPNNQINIVIYINECGQYFIDRNDFLATNLNSAGRNNWVSLFIQTPDVTKAKFYQEIVHFYQAIYPKFWDANMLVDIKFKDSLHVIQFKNPTHLSVGILNISNQQVQVLNHFNWILLGDNSPLAGRIENLVRGKNDVSSIIYIQYLESNNGTHFEIGYLDSKSLFHTTYLLYIPANDAFTDDTSSAFSVSKFESEAYNNPLPANIVPSILNFIVKGQTETDVTVVLSYIVLAPRQYAVDIIHNFARWRYVLNWANQSWSVVSKQPIADGYHVSHGVPSTSAAACTGFIRKLYPTVFVAPFVYVLIETKTIGLNLFTRIIFNTGYEAVVSSTFGVRNSEVLQSWRPILFVKPQSDFGYGKESNINYGVSTSYFYDQQAPKKALTSEPVTVVAAPISAAPVEATPSGCPPGTKLIFSVCVPSFSG